jgi:hypothetical protein
MDGSGYAIAYPIYYGGFALFVLAVLGGAWVLLRKGYTKSGLLVLAALFLAGVLPAALSQWETGKIAKAAQGASFAPDSIDFAGKKVIFAETAFTICEDDICGYAVRHGGLSEVYWVAANNLKYTHPDLDWPFDAISKNVVFYRMGLTDPETSQSGLALPDPVAEMQTRPDVDYTVLVDDSFVTLEYAQAFGLPEDIARRVRFSFMVFEGWPEPGQAPVARLLTAQYSVEPYFLWPVSSRHTYSPPLFDHRNQVRSWFCAEPMDSVYFGADQCPPR